ncbi:barstar family protein [Phenylobacterium sp.]|jgi:hypothetical protein|uniref:barstar family protein n=1 Tax=Phenylobacterium sp. TaxID=1871053 RepID=UPI002F93E266
MRTTVVVVPTDAIVDWDTFHSVFEHRLEFPSYYGRNMDAWIDCLTYADDAGMLGQAVAKGGLLTLRLEGHAAFKERCPAQYEALVECTGFVNSRRIEIGEEPVLALLLT